jgi:hypothetical protein
VLSRFYVNNHQAISFIASVYPRRVTQVTCLKGGTAAKLNFPVSVIGKAMQVWPQHGWFVALRCALFERGGRKRALAALLIIILALVGTVEMLSRPDPARTEREQYDVYSAYLFRVSGPGTALPVRCTADPRYIGRLGVATIQRYFVSDQSTPAALQSSTFTQLVRAKTVGSGTPISMFNNFLFRNLSAEELTPKFSAGNSQVLVLARTQPDLSATSQPALWAKFTNVGFNRDFSWAMFYADVSCKGVNGGEYVYMRKAFHHGWYWYIDRIEPK